MAGFGALAGGASARTPLDYGSALKLFMLGDSGVTHSSNDVSAWVDQSSSGLTFSVPGSSTDPLRLPATQNGLQGISFEEKVGGPDLLRRRLTNAANVVDNFFTGGTSKSIAFVARIDDISNSFSTSNTIISKGHADSNGWNLEITTSGTVRFRHRRSNSSNWTLQASGFYSEDDLVMGRLTYNGGNSSGSGSFRLWNGSSFVTTGSVTTASGSTSTGTESTRDLILGNILDTANANNNAPFGGPILALWMTSPSSTSFDDEYMARWAA